MKTTVLLATVAIVAALGAAGLVTAVSFSTQAHAQGDTELCHHRAHQLGINLAKNPNFCKDADH